jgi:hypothetical protein
MNYLFSEQRDNILGILFFLIFLFLFVFHCCDDDVFPMIQMNIFFCTIFFASSQIEVNLNVCFLIKTSRNVIRRNFLLYS